MLQEEANMADQHTPQDPTEQYESIEPPRQSQPEPGLDKDMKPQADHGQSSYHGTGKLTGRKVLITGGDSGIGRAVAIAFAREGADVAIAYLPSEQPDADETIKQISEAGASAVSLPGDLRDESYARRLVHDVYDQLGGLDIVINNAGKQIFNDDLTTIPSEQIKDTFAINILAMFWICQEAIPLLPEGGAIINTTSIVATQPSPGLIDYAATKGAISTFTKGLAQQLADKGIRVNGVAPGPIWTPLQPSHGQSQDKLTSFGQDTPLGRAGQPAELASTYVFLASQESSYITGEIIAVTGGRLT